MRCANCDGTEFEPGFLEDKGATPFYIRWIAGPISRGVLGGAKRAGKTRWDVVAHRCSACGHLEFFATEPN